jgi:hypothetical protein
LFLIFLEVPREVDVGGGEPNAFELSQIEELKPL